ncbi:MAG: HipA N-terminal domain-containing protein [Balneolaceae bacterium]
MMHGEVLMHGNPAGILESQSGGVTEFRYHATYSGPPVSVTLPVRSEPYTFSGFPSFFDGLLPEGTNLDMLLAQHKLQADEVMLQLLAVGSNLIGAVTVKKSEP